MLDETGRALLLTIPRYARETVMEYSRGMDPETYREYMVTIAYLFENHLAYLADEDSVILACSMAAEYAAADYADAEQAMRCLEKMERKVMRQDGNSWIVMVGIGVLAIVAFVVAAILR